jgi:hypothetical protein
MNAMGHQQTTDTYYIESGIMPPLKLVRTKLIGTTTTHKDLDSTGWTLSGSLAPGWFVYTKGEECLLWNRNTQVICLQYKLLRTQKKSLT